MLVLVAACRNLLAACGIFVAAFRLHLAVVHRLQSTEAPKLQPVCLEGLCR